MAGNGQTQSVTYRQEAHFRVMIGGTEDAGTFVKAGPLMKAKVDPVVIRTGTSLTPESDEPGNVTYEPVVLEQGVSENRLLEDWFNEISNNGGVTGNVGPGYKRQVRIEQLDRDMTTVLESYTYNEAYISDFDDGGFDAESSKNRMRSVTIRFKGKPIKKRGA